MARLAREAAAGSILYPAPGTYRKATQTKPEAVARSVRRFGSGIFCAFPVALKRWLRDTARREEMTMSKKPKIDHEYHAGKDKMRITIEGYSPSKKSRDAIMKNLMTQLEKSPDRIVAKFKKKPKETSGKERRGLPKEARLIEIGD